MGMVIIIYWAGLAFTVGFLVQGSQHVLDALETYHDAQVVLSRWALLLINPRLC